MHRVNSDCLLQRLTLHRNNKPANDKVVILGDTNPNFGKDERSRGILVLSNSHDNGES